MNIIALSLLSMGIFSYALGNLREIPDINGQHRSINKELALVKTDENFDGDEFFTSNGLIRINENNITDKGIFNNPYDVVNIKNIYDRCSDDFANEDNYYNETNSSPFNYDSQWANYQTIGVNLKLSIKEINDGYQHIYIYNGSTSSSDLICHGRLDHGVGYTNTSWKEYNLYFEIPINMVNNYTFYIRYNATGYSSDTWVNKIVISQISLSTDPRYTTSMWQLDWVDESHYSYQELSNSSN